jgi:hypothetical protein
MKEEKQLTSVEWLCNEWLYLDQQFDMCLIDRNIYWDKLRQIQEKAKEMEKEQKRYSEVEVIEAIRLARKTELKTEGYDPRPFTGNKYLEEEIINQLTE